ncbi:zinc finger protein 37-like [Wyeomyia smithii]|uniref:zinc finger protein 37-like n=1 Tax=Wyeomyia smithii TaxID=174621 RepID=UPI002467C211|nr:zinc finger protein 37-like [Wyeomyia smithii]
MMENILLKEAIIMANSNNMCRLCLSANGITEPICYDQRDQFLLQKIYECTTLQISPLAGIPSSLCTICKARLDEFYQFRWQCIKNDEIIRRIADNFPKNQQQSSPPQPTTPEIGNQNPKQEIIEINSTQLQPVDEPSEYIATGSKRSETPDRYPHPEHVSPERSDPVPYGMSQHDHIQHNQYNVDGTISSNVSSVESVHPVNFPPETKYPMSEPMAQQFQFTDFRRKRGRPPKQKYDQYHHPIVKYGESSIDDSKTQNSIDCSESSNTMIDEPETILAYGDSSRSGDYQQESVYGRWPSEQKIKLEQTDNQVTRYEEQHNTTEGHHEHEHKDYLKHLSDNSVQTAMSTDGFVKRSRGRPPREGGCPNQDRTEYRFQCQYCDARFKAAINLKLHTNTHTGERPYKCQLCDKSFAHPSNLSVHSKLHMQGRVKREGAPSEKKFQCPYCHTLFALAFQLKIHINTHTGQKPYVCKNCGKGFAQPSNLHVHVKKHCHKRTEYETMLAGPSVAHQQQDPLQSNSPVTTQLNYHAMPLHHHEHPLVPRSTHQQQQHSPHVQPANHAPETAAVSGHVLPAPHPQHLNTPEHPQLQQQHDTPPTSSAPSHSLTIPSVMLV